MKGTIFDIAIIAVMTVIITIIAFTLCTMYNVFVAIIALYIIMLYCEELLRKLANRRVEIERRNKK